MGDDAGLLARAAAAMVDLLARQRQLQAGHALVDALDREGAEPVSGERQFFDALAARVDQACGRLHDEPQAGGVEAVEALLAAVEWDLVPTLLAQLERRRTAHQAAVDEATSRLRVWDVRFTELENVINGARLAGAPFGALEDELKAAERRLAQLRSSLADRLYGQLAAQCDAAQQAIASLEAKVAQASARIGRVKGLVRQADLLIMNTGSADGDYVYRVLLRRADRSPTGGISIIQEIRRLSRADRDEYLQGGFEQLGAALLPRADGTPPPPTDIAGKLRGLGRFMGQMLISESMRDVLWNEDWSFSITTNDLQLPWELISLEPPSERLRGNPIHPRKPRKRPESRRETKLGRGPSEASQRRVRPFSGLTRRAGAAKGAARRCAACPHASAGGASRLAQRPWLPRRGRMGLPLSL